MEVIEVLVGPESEWCGGRHRGTLWENVTQHLDRPRKKRPSMNDSSHDYKSSSRRRKQPNTAMESLPHPPSTGVNNLKLTRVISSCISI